MPHLGHGKICHVALPAVDVDQSAGFYQAVFDWQVHRQPHAVTFDDGVGEVSGHFVPHRAPTEPGVLIYLWVDDLEAALERLTEAGGVVVQPVGVDPEELTAWFRDPAGNVLGVYQEPPS